MARFSKKGNKSDSPHESGRHTFENFPTNPSLFNTTEVAKRGTYDLSSFTSDHKAVSTVLAYWPSKPSQATPQQSYQKPKPKHIPIEILPYQLAQTYTSRRSPEQPGNHDDNQKARLPRHVPIIIPDFAHPYILDPIRASVDLNGQDITRTTSEGVVYKLGISKAKSSLSSSQTHQRTGPEDPAVKLERGQRLVMNSSQVSLSTASESGVDNVGVLSRSTSHAGNGTRSLGIVSPTSQSGSATNLSALVCNVHRTTGQEPHALVGATTTILGDNLYVFGGRIHSRTKPQLTSDLYKLDLIRRHWTKLDTTGNIPPPRYFHSMCALGDTKLVCYGGMSPAPHLRDANGRPSQPNEGLPEVVVMSDIHIFDIPKRKWFLVSGSTAGTDGPQGRYAHCATIVPSSAVFSSSTAAHSAIHHNRSATDDGSTHSGSLGVQLDGSGGAEMIVVGGQDSANNYIEQISVFNLRSLRWTSTTPYEHKCGAYKSMVAPLIGINASDIGRDDLEFDDNGRVVPTEDASKSLPGTSTLIYSNYDFLDVKLELQIRLPDGQLVERRMKSRLSPPGLRFPNGGIINNHFVVSGTHLTSSKHDYALWALDLRSLTWGRIDTAGSVFSQASWNRGILWNRRNTFVILGHRKRNLVDDYNHRRINFSHICLVELEAFGLYENPRKTTPSSAYVSISAPAIPASLQSSLPSRTAGGRQMSAIASQLGQTAMMINELSDMEIVAMTGERISCNSQVLARRWGPYFNQLLMESSTSRDVTTMSEAATLRSTMHSQASRSSTMTITPRAPNVSDSSTFGGNSGVLQRSMSQSTSRTLVELPSTNEIPASSRPRILYLPHTAQTIRLLLDYLYTSSLPPVSSPLCSAHTLCSLLQMARPYQIDGLHEATVQRLHEVLDGRNAPAVFNAAAMAAGGGRGTGTGSGGTLAALERRESTVTSTTENDRHNTSPTKIRSSVNDVQQHRRGHSKSSSVDSSSTATSASTSTGLSQTDNEASAPEGENQLQREKSRGVWTGDISAVIGLQKRGLRGLMEGRRLRERANTIGNGD